MQRKGGDSIPEKEKKAAETLVKAVSVLPEGKVEYLLGFAEGAVAAAEKKQVPPTTDEPAS